MHASICGAGYEVNDPIRAKLRQKDLKEVVSRLVHMQCTCSVCGLVVYHGPGPESEKCPRKCGDVRGFDSAKQEYIRGR